MDILWRFCSLCAFDFTGEIEKFSAKENFRKLLKVSHFYLGFSSNKKP